MSSDSTSAAFFEDMYSRAPDRDPWDFEYSAYEQRRYRTLIELLGADQFDRAFEPGCSVGAFSRMLAAHCSRVVAVDLSHSAVAEAKARSRRAGVTNVDFTVGAFPQVLGPNSEPFDLVCLVEVGYYFAADPWRDAVRRAIAVTATPGAVLLSHWTGSSSDHLMSGDEVHDIAADELAAAGLAPAAERERHPGFLVELWRHDEERG